MIMRRRIIFFLMAVMLGLGAADHQVRDFHDAAAEICVYGWRTRDKAVDVVWMGEVYPALSWNKAGDVIVEAGGLGCNLTDGSETVIHAVKTAYRQGAELLRTMWAE